jgi:hypothetical protein
MTDLRRLVQATVRPTRRPASMMKAELEVAAFADFGVLGARAIAYCGVGLELHDGECLLAAIGSHDARQGFEHRLAGAITNRRVLFGGWSSVKGQLNDVRGCVMHDEVLGLDAKSGMLGSTFDVQTPRGPQKLVALFGHYPEIEGFVRGLLQIPIGYRGEPAFAMPMPSAADPSGAEAAMAALWNGDPRAGTLLHTIAGMLAHGSMTAELAGDFVTRVTLAHRAVCCGPAGNGSSFVSPLSADDLGNLLVGALGQPMAYGAPQPGTHALDFRFDPQRDSISPALAALGIASFIGLGIGLSPGRMIAAEMMRKPPLHAIRIVYGDIPGGCAYELYGNGRRLEIGEAELAHGLHQLLVHGAWPILERRVHFGWQVPYAELVR